MMRRDNSRRVKTTMKASGGHFKYCFALFLLAGRMVSADVNNIPHSQIVCATAPSPLPGLDVSVYQSRANWTTVGNAGNSFAFIKATQGAGISDSAFPTQWPAAANAGLLRSPYHYFVPTDDPIKQATFFLNTVGSLADTDLAPMFDWEITNGLGATAVVANAQKFLDYVEQQTGRIPIIYTNAAFFNQIGNPSGFDRYPLYISDYGARCPKVPQPWINWTFWQYSSTGNVSGISGNTDLDYFNGVFNDLANFITSDVPVGVQGPDFSNDSQ
jgi:lysozyme